MTTNKPVNEDLPIEKTEKSSLRKAVEGTAGALAIVSVATNVAGATEKLAGEVFIHEAGFSAKIGNLTLETGVKDPNMKVIFLETDDEGLNPRELKGSISRELFTGSLVRTEEGAWALPPDNWFEILKQSSLEPSPEGRGGYFGEESVIVDFETLEYPMCKYDKNNGGAKAFMSCRKVKVDGKEYESFSETLEEYLALKAREAELDAEYAETQQRVSTKLEKKSELAQGIKKDKQSIFETQQKEQKIDTDISELAQKDQELDIDISETQQRVEGKKEKIEKLETEVDARINRLLTSAN